MWYKNMIGISDTLICKIYIIKFVVSLISFKSIIIT